MKISGNRMGFTRHGLILFITKQILFLQSLKKETA